ncbi:MAG: hypothetical protein Q8Q94_02530 [bacterium]|nr:hypothetical protein [bacterium]MDZ4299776.1 hypothetical protein [Candidatus Sungbacteria bacterium]
MNTVTITKKEYRELKTAKRRLDELSNIPPKKRSSVATEESFADLVGALSDVEEFKGKTSVEVQHMVPEIWSKRTSRKHS